MPSENHRDLFLVFSLPRCGSTTLRQLLNCHSGVRCLEEPFNRYNHGGRYLEPVIRTGTLDDALRIIWAQFNGIKHTWYPDGWPFADPSLNRRLLLKPNVKVIFLRRKNLLRRIISNQISAQTNVWGIVTPEDIPRVRNFHFSAMDVPATKARLLVEHNAVLQYRSMLVSNKSVFKEVCYEDLYDPQNSVQERLRDLNALFVFLGREPVYDADSLTRIHALLEPTKMRLNSAATYRLIPGIEQLENECGSDETGWVFKG